MKSREILLDARSVTDSTNAQRQERFRKAKARAGYIRLQVWLHPDDIKPIKAMIQRAKTERTKSEKIAAQVSVGAWHPVVTNRTD